MSSINEIILNHQQRGLTPLFPFLKADACEAAADAICRLNKGSIWIVTGFCCFGKGESDGPLGSHFLALALQKMGFSPRLITDSYSHDYFNDLHNTAGHHETTNRHETTDRHDTTGQHDTTGSKQPSPVSIPYPTYCFQNLEALLQLFETEKPVALIAVERCGRAKDGKYYSMRKKDISAVTPPLDELFLRKPSNCISIGIGDGGNEIGMGCYHDLLAAHCDIIPSCVRCDFPIMATVSNWGAYGLIAALEQYRSRGLQKSPEALRAAQDTLKRPHDTLRTAQDTLKSPHGTLPDYTGTSKATQEKLLPTPDEVQAFFQHLLQSGAPDGISGPGHPSVDGFPISYDLEVIGSF